MPKRDTQYMEQVREQILEAAQSCLLRQGYGKTSVRDICEESGLSIGAIYVHFKNKSEILLSLLRRATDERDARISSQSLEELESRITGLLDNLEDPSRGNLVRFDLQLLVDAQTNNEIGAHLRAKVNTFETSLLRELKRCTAGAVMPPQALELAAARLHYMVLGGAIKILHGGQSQQDTYAACVTAEFDQLRRLADGRR